MQAGIGGKLCQLHHGHPHDVIGAVVFTSRSAVPDGRDADWLRWGTQLMLHSDLDDDTHQMWMCTQPQEVMQLRAHGAAGSVGSTIAYDIPAWISLEALELGTRTRLYAEACRRYQAVYDAEYVLAARHMDKTAGKLDGKASVILKHAKSVHAAALEARWCESYKGKSKMIDGGLITRAAHCLLAEFRAEGRCDMCGGSGVLPHVVDDRRKEIRCPACYGTGVSRRSDRKRAAAMDISRGRYARAWKAPYEWLYGEALTARRQAVRLFREQLE